MKRFKTNLLISLFATIVGLAITGIRYIVNDYNLMSVIITTIITIVSCMGFAYLMDGLSYISKKIGGR